MKLKKASKKSQTEPSVMRDTTVPYTTASGSEPMVRTQIYLNKAEYDFIQSEATRREQPMAAIMRGYIDEKMTIPDEVWANNPLLREPVEDPSFEGHEDGAINHDHYIYGCPKKYIKVDGKWVPAPPPEE